MILLDTNVISELMTADAAARVIAWFDLQDANRMCTTAVNIFEVRSGIARLLPGARRDAFSSDFARFLLDDLGGRVVAFDSHAADLADALDGQRRAIGRTVEFRDTLIAGIAIANRATLATRNARHFADLPTPVVDPWAA